MLVAAVLLIATTIRLSAYARRRELGIMRLVGASNRFIQTPFILEGVFAALLGSLLAGAAVLAGVHFGVDQYLRQRVEFVTTWVSVADAWVVVPILILIGAVLAALLGRLRDPALAAGLTRVACAHGAQLPLSGGSASLRAVRAVPGSDLEDLRTRIWPGSGRRRGRLLD